MGRLFHFFSLLPVAFPFPSWAACPQRPASLGGLRLGVRKKPGEESGRDRSASVGIGSASGRNLPEPVEIGPEPGEAGPSGICRNRSSGMKSKPEGPVGTVRSGPVGIGSRSGQPRSDSRGQSRSPSGKAVRKNCPGESSDKTGPADSSGPGRSADPVSKAGWKAIPSKSLSFPLPVPFPESGRAAVQVQVVPDAPLPVSVPVFQARSPEIRPTGQSVPDAVQK